MNLEALLGLGSKPITGVWYRAILPKFLTTSLQYSQTREVPSRFNAGRFSQNPFATLYLAEDPIGALFEVEALFGSSLNPSKFISNPAASYITLNVQVELRNVLDLTNLDNIRALATSAQELTGDWRGYYLPTELGGGRPGPAGIAPTQELGAAIYASGQFAGFLTRSAKIHDKLVLGVLPERIVQSDFARYHYTDAAGQEQIFKIP